MPQTRSVLPTVAALYDVHANLPALEAVLADVPEDATILLGGDHVYGPFPAETLAHLRGLGERAVWLRGNCDRELSEPGTGPASLDVLDWVRDRLSPEQVAFLHHLPATVTLTIDGLGEVFFCHATPHNDTDFFTDATPRSGGAYVNMMMEEGEERIQATYRGNYERLAQVKRKYDPGNLFHVNQNIRPA
jgi:hypothetical protein